MTDLNEYLEKRGITEEQMDAARERTQAAIDAYKLREARKACGMTQVQMAEAMGVSQNRVSRMENGDIGVMSVDSVRRYVEALGGRLTLVADLPTGKVSLVR
jgi:DNA-binding XRE family transcriptional regulator